MTQVNHGKGDKMTSHEIDVASIKSQQQSTKFVNPGERTLTGETVFVDIRVEQTFASAFGGFAIAFVLSHVGNNPVIEADFASGFSVKSAIGVEERAREGQS